MSWIDRLMGRKSPDLQREHAEDKKALDELHTAYEKVQTRTTRLERELLRVNAELRNRLGQTR